ncbi:MAG: arylsulfatase [Planctomycetaceae bacterium]|jgi:arylsulfatase A-like enzyme|nr:arylsulfatase [Planctomycetaceae bacterium]
MKLSFPLKLSAVLFVLLSLSLQAQSALADSPPNIVVFLSDDQGWGDFGFQGNSNFQTPNLDQLAHSGAVCQRFYVCPVCAPTRAEFLTGRYHPRGSAMGVTQGDERLDLDETTLADRFKKAGYATGAFGKWHNGSQFPYHPNARGFDEFYGFCSGHWGDYFSPPLEHNGNKVQGNGFVADDFTNHAIDFIEQHASQPFFCYVAFNTPHSPMQVPDDYWDRVKDRPLTMRHLGRPAEKEDEPTTRAAIAMVENLDWNVGRVLQRLDQLQLRNNTIVVYFNDNGPNSFRWNACMKGRKGTLDEGGVRTPLIIQWPGVIPPNHRVAQLSGAIDITPTLCELAKIPIDNDPDHPLDGISIAKQILNPSTPNFSRSLFTHWSGRVAMRQDLYLLDPDNALFDLINDPSQQRDLAHSEPEKAASMANDVKRWREQVLRSAQTNRPFLVGHPQRPIAILPAQDGKCKGPSIKRSDTAPNCSFFTNIRTTEDAVFWELEFLQAGSYSAWIHYTASESVVGKKLKMTVADHELIGSIASAHDSPLRGDQNDRVPRKSESLMKNFQTAKLGTINLTAKRGSCEIRLVEPVVEDGCLEIQAIEFRLEKQ